ncbi:MAG: hypothetical protein PHP44_12135 [Kiritimatiellae bacterium]|nr:hypothetical protein [Kiritimatiellia bacterium]MDD4736838.1 hypothetical protein [Kiritimatiellia bacterium]
MAKRILHWCVLLAALLVVGRGQAQVLSLNAVGVLSVELQADEPQLVAIQLIPVEASGVTFTVPQVFGTNNLVPGMRVGLYDAVSEGYCVEEFSGGSWTPGTCTVQRGQSVWVQSPSNTVLKLSGCVPGSGESNTTVQVVLGMQLMGCPYPVNGAYTNGFLGVGAPGDVVVPLAGDGAVATNATAVTYYSGTGWFPPDGRFDLASGWWYKSYSNRTWTVTKPYDYP